MDNGDRAGSCRFHQRGGAAVIGEIGIRASHKQRFDNARMTGERRGHQRRAFQRGTHIHTGALLEQQLHAIGVVIGDAGSEQQGWLRMFDLGLGAVLEQERRDIPVCVAASDPERRHAVCVDRVHIGGGVEQQRRDDRFRAACRMVQRRVAGGVRGARVGTVREQGRDRFRTALITVARSRDQWGDATVNLVHVDAFGDQRAQQAQVRQGHRDHQCTALVALVGSWQRIRVATALKRRQREADLRGVRGAQQRCIEFGASDAGRQRWGFLRSGRFRRADNFFTGVPRAARVRQQRTEAAVQEQAMRQRRENERIQRERRNAHIAGEEAAESGQQQGANRQQQKPDAGGQSVAEEQFVLASEVTRECERAAQCRQ